MSDAPRVSLVNATATHAEVVEFRAGEPTLIAKATFAIVGSALEPADVPLPLSVDVHAGDPRTTAPRYESDFVPWKPRADALCVGNAYPGDAKRATHCVAAFG